MYSGNDSKLEKAKTIEYQRQSSQWLGFSDKDTACGYLAYAQKLIGNGNPNNDAKYDTVSINSFVEKITQFNNSDARKYLTKDDYQIIAPKMIKNMDATKDHKTIDIKNNDRVHFLREDNSKEDPDCTRQIYSPKYTNEQGKKIVKQYNYYIEGQDGKGNNIFVYNISKDLPGGLADKYISDEGNWKGNYCLYKSTGKTPIGSKKAVGGPIYQVNGKWYVVYENDYPHSIGIPIHWLVCDISII